MSQNDHPHISREKNTTYTTGVCTQEYARPATVSRTATTCLHDIDSTYRQYTHLKTKKYMTQDTDRLQYVFLTAGVKLLWILLLLVCWAISSRTHQNPHLWVNTNETKSRSMCTTPGRNRSIVHTNRQRVLVHTSSTLGIQLQ